jgi:quaternary ammonium compound-resistance protein SugE
MLFSNVYVYWLLLVLAGLVWKNLRISSVRNGLLLHLAGLVCMVWLYLVIAGCFEVAWAVGLKYSDGFSRFWPSIFTGISMIASFFLLSQALRTIPIGTGYAVWTGIGVAGTAILGILLFSESASLPRLMCIGLIVAGILGLKVIAGL